VLEVDAEERRLRLTMRLENSVSPAAVRCVHVCMCVHVHVHVCVCVCVCVCVHVFCVFVGLFTFCMYCSSPLTYGRAVPTGSLVKARVTRVTEAGDACAESILS
jgi:hypothetical protein